MLCPCDNITGYLNGLQYLFRLLAGIASGTFLFALPLSHALSLLSPSSPSLLLRYPCSYAILALTPSSLLRHPRSYNILALTPSLLLQHPCSLTSLLLTHIFFQVIFSPFYLCPHALFHSYSLSACVNFLLSTSTTYGVYQDACPVVI